MPRRLKKLIHRLLVGSVLAFAVAAGGAGAGTGGEPGPAEIASVPVGAIRWDYWFPGSPEIALLEQPRWSGRVPFFARRLPDGGLEVAGDVENVLHAEVAYARAAGLDYFIFGFYPETGSWGREPGRHIRLNRALLSYLRLPDRSGVRFALSLNQSFPASDFAEMAGMLAAMVAHPDYMRTPAGTAPVFVFGHEPESWSRSLGTAERFRDAFRALRSEVRARTGTDMTVVFMHADPQRAAELARALGFDMASAYVTPAGAGGRELPYAECGARMRGNWRRLAETGMPFLPNVTVGWDYRPRTLARGGRVDAPSSANWCAAPDADELGAVLRDALRVAAERREQPFRSVVVYAWNEFTEGGWLAPTWSEGAARIAALRAALGRGRAPPPEVELTWPDDRISAPACPVRSVPRNRDKVLEACAERSSPEAAPPWPCPPGMRVLSDAVRAPTGFEAARHDGAWNLRRCGRED